MFANNVYCNWKLIFAEFVVRQYYFVNRQVDGAGNEEVYCHFYFQKLFPITDRRSAPFEKVSSKSFFCLFVRQGRSNEPFVVQSTGYRTVKIVVVVRNFSRLVYDWAMSKQLTRQQWQKSKRRPISNTKKFMYLNQSRNEKMTKIRAWKTKKEQTNKLWPVECCTVLISCVL